MSVKKKLTSSESVRIAFFGDSVTQGCFEGDYDPANEAYTYRSRFCKKLGQAYPQAKIEMINAGIAGNISGQGLYRMQRDVLDRQPDLCIVCFGINDSSCTAITRLTKRMGLARPYLELFRANTDQRAFALLEQAKPMEAYWYAMSRILDKLQENNIPVILLTPNCMSRKGILDRKNPAWLGSYINAWVMKRGNMDRVMETARSLARERGIPVADGYARWLELERQGVVTPESFANGTNHPSRELHAELAQVLFRTFEVSDL